MGEEEPAPFWSRKCLPPAADVGRADRVNAVLELTRLALGRCLLSPDTAKTFVKRQFYIQNRGGGSSHVDNKIPQCEYY